MTADNPVLAAALKYARMGIGVFPVRGKRPIPENGFLDASVNQEVIRAWFSSSAAKDYGVACRIPEWACVVDVDGDEGFQYLKDHGFTLPSTARAKSGRGWHYWYMWDGVESPKRKIAFLPKVDILANGFVVMPPSRHPDGGEYSWDDDVKFSKDTIEIAPSWIKTSIQTERSLKDGLTDEEILTGLPKGQRQNGLFLRASRLRGIGNSRGEAKAILRELAQKSGSGDYDTDALVERVWKTYEANAEKEHHEDEEKVWSLVDLLAENMEPPSYLVEGLLPGLGYTIFSAPQKAGKSAFAAQVALCVATGSRLLGRVVEPAGVLVCDIEQDGAAAAVRWRKLLLGHGLAKAPGNLHISFSWPSIDHGGFERLGKFLVDHPSVRLVVLDTLADFYPENEGHSGDAYTRQSFIMRKFDRFSKDYGVALLIITHNRKPQNQDSFADQVSGTRAITGKAKAIWSLHRETLENTGYLIVSGKNIAEEKINMTFDTEHMCWR